MHFLQAPIYNGPMTHGYAFLSGATLMASFVCALFFLSFWRRTHDRFFGIFALAFFLLGLERVAIFCIFRSVESEANAPVYLIRLSAFLIIYYAIWDKNRTAPKGSS